MVTVRARESFNYAGIDRPKGVSFEASAADADILIKIGRVEVAPVKRVQAPVAVLEDVTDGDVEEAAVATAPRRNYRRKDLVAE